MHIVIDIHTMQNSVYSTWWSVPFRHDVLVSIFNITARMKTETFQFGEISTIFYPFASCIAGVCAGALGIAGGLIKGVLVLLK